MSYLHFSLERRSENHFLQQKCVQMRQSLDEEMVSLDWWRWRSDTRVLRAHRALWYTCTGMAERCTSKIYWRNSHSPSLLSPERKLLPLEEQYTSSQLWQILRLRAWQTSELQIAILRRKHGLVHVVPLIDPVYWMELFLCRKTEFESPMFRITVASRSGHLGSEKAPNSKLKPINRETAITLPTFMLHRKCVLL